MPRPPDQKVGQHHLATAFRLANAVQTCGREYKYYCGLTVSPDGSGHCVHAADRSKRWSTGFGTITVAQLRCKGIKSLLTGAMANPRSVASLGDRSAPVLALPTSKPRRLIELDILRGFLLLGMTLTHLPTKASTIFNQPFGFVSDAEGFIFLAAFMVGQIEQRTHQKHGESGVLRDVLRRTFRIYFYQCALLAVAFTLVAEVALRFHRLSLENLLSFYLQSPKQALIAAALLEYRPSLMDILPMYIVFMLLTPVARKIARSLGWETVLFVSLLVWAGAQFGLRDWLYYHTSFFGLHVPESSTGAFDLYGWQLLWMLGLALGSIYVKSLSGMPLNVTASNSLMPRWLVKLCSMVAIAFLVLRYAPADHWVNVQLYDWLVDKWHLGAVRLINFAAIALVLVRFGRQIAELPMFMPLASLGQASIQVFSVHVLFCIAGHALNKGADSEPPLWEQGILLTATISALFITADLVAKRTGTNNWGRGGLISKNAGIAKPSVSAKVAQISLRFR